jgi:hypothetical protein
MNHYSIHLPTKPFLGKWLLSQYGTDDGVIILDPSTDFGDIIITKLSSDLHSKLDPSDLASRLQHMTATLTIKVPMTWMRRMKQIDPTQHQAVSLNRYFENMFIREMCDIVQRAFVFSSIDRQTSIECFAHNHGIILEKDISFEGLKKMEYRFRKKTGLTTITTGKGHVINQNKFVPETSRRFAAIR